jgi:hypothetical protein
MDLRRTIEPVVEKVLRTLFFWTNSETEFGNMVIMAHLSFVVLIAATLLTTFVCRVPTSVIVAVIVVFGLIVVQHLLIGVCLFSSIEKRVLGAPYPIMDPILHLFHIPTSRESRIGVTALLISFTLLILVLQLVRTWLHDR